MDDGWKYVKVSHGFSGQELVAEVLVPAPIPGDPFTQENTVKSKLCQERDNS